MYHYSVSGFERQKKPFGAELLGHMTHMGAQHISTIHYKSYAESFSRRNIIKIYGYLVYLCDNNGTLSVVYLYKTVMLILPS
jgi:hypothetical protein